MHVPTVTPPRQAITGIVTVLAGAILLGAGPPVAWTTPAAVQLGTAAGYAVLAGGGITDTGPSIIVGDVGTHPFPAIPDLLDREASGSVDRAGAKSQQAQRDLARAFASLAALPRGGTVSIADDQTLPPGVYAVADPAQDHAASLTLDGQDAPNAVWIIAVERDLVTAPGSTITLVNGAQACNVFWHVEGSATLAPGSTFAGSILARTSVTVGSSVTIAGRLLAGTGAVALAGASITVPVCTQNAAAAGPQPAAAASQPPVTSASAVVAGSASTLPAFVPILLLVMAALLGEPHRRHRRRGRHVGGGWWHRGDASSW